MKKNRIKYLLFLTVFLLFAKCVHSQEVILAKYQFASNGDLNPDIGAIGSPNISISSGSGFSSWNGNPQSSLYGYGGDYIELVISALGYKDIKVEWDGYKRFNGTGQWRMRLDSGGGYGGFIFTQDCPLRSWASVSESLNAAFNNNGSVKIWIEANVNQYVYLDNLTVKGTPLDNIPPVFQNPQGNITTSTDAGLCGAVVNFTIPIATDNNLVPNGAISGYSYLGQLNGHSYYYSNRSVNVTTAMQNSINAGGHLLVINSQAENDWIDNRTGGIWIGYNDVASEGNFVWVTGETNGYENWNTGEPNNSNGEDYTVMYSNGSWNDLRGTRTSRYILEFQSVIVTQTAGLPSGSLFPVGTTTNTFLATDNSGNMATHSFDVIVTDNSPPVISRLQASYYDGINFDIFKEILNVNTLNYSWGSGAPASSLVGVDDFSIRFKGHVQAPQTGTYTFFTTSDDGVRLWVDGTRIVNNWTNHGPTVNSGTIHLTAGVLTPITLEFYERGGGAVIKLEWSGPGLSRAYVADLGVSTCNDLTLDISATGAATILVDDIDPGYTDPCGIATRVLSKTNFTCSDAGDNAVTLTVTDVNNNSTSCEINVSIIGTPDNSLSITGDTKCEGDDANVLIENSENGVVYSCYIGASQVGGDMNGTGSDLNVIIPSADVSIGSNTIIIKASKGACELNLINNATVLINPIPKPIGVFYD